jgi:hypothetical protein
MNLLITPGAIEREFLRLMRQYSRYSWATAWAGASSNCFVELAKHKRKIRKIVVGTHFYQTHPDFIKEFLGSDTVRFISRTDDLFHPKIYLFEDDNRNWELLIGSANFTKAAFTANTEAAVLIGSKDVPSNMIYAEAKRLIGNTWKDAETFDTKELAKYQIVWDKHKAKLGALGGKYGTKPGKPLHESAVVTMTWPDFYRKVCKSGAAIVTSRLKVLNIVTSRFQQLKKQGKHFNDLSDNDRKAIAGTLHRKRAEALYGVDMNWFGSMMGNGIFRNQVIKKNANLSLALDAIPLTGEVDESHYREFVKYFEKVKKGGIATGTRLLAMKRPDLFVCLDVRNRANLCEDFGITAANMTFEKYWGEMIGRISESAWWNAPAPKDERELNVWQGRSAFLDSIYYED